MKYVFALYLHFGGFTYYEIVYEKLINFFLFIYYFAKVIKIRTSLKEVLIYLKNRCS